MINYVINLDRRTDRWEEFLHTLKSSKELSNDTFIRISGFDGLNSEEELKKYNFTNHNFIKYIKLNNIPINNGVFGCYMSHLITLYNILQNKDIKDEDYVGIYEEDFRLCKGFDYKYKEFRKIDLNDIGVDFIYHGGRNIIDFDSENFEMFEKTKNDNIFLRKNNKPGGYLWDRCAFSFIIKKSICSKLIKLVTTNFIYKVNQFKPIDHVYADLHNDIKMFDYFPHIIWSEFDYKTDVQI